MPLWKFEILFWPKYSAPAEITEIDRWWLVDFNAGKTQLVSFDWSNNTGAIYAKMEGSALEEKPSFKILGELFLLRLLCISISLQSYHTSIYGILLSHLEWFPWLLLGIVGQATKMDIQDCWSFTCCFSWTLGSSWKCGQLKSFLDVFVRCSSGLNQLVPLPFSKGDQHVVLIDCMIFLSPFLEVTRMSISTVSFLAQLDYGILCL